MTYEHDAQKCSGSLLGGDFLPAIDWQLKATESWISHTSQTLEEGRYKQRGSSRSPRTFPLSNHAFLEVQDIMRQLIIEEEDCSMYGSFSLQWRVKASSCWQRMAKEESTSLQRWLWETTCHVWVGITCWTAIMESCLLMLAYHSPPNPKILWLVYGDLILWKNPTRLLGSTWELSTITVCSTGMVYCRQRCPRIVLFKSTLLFETPTISTIRQFVPTTTNPHLVQTVMPTTWLPPITRNVQHHQDSWQGERKNVWSKGRIQGQWTSCPSPVEKDSACGRMSCSICFHFGWDSFQARWYMYGIKASPLAVFQCLVQSSLQENGGNLKNPDPAEKTQSFQPWHFHQNPEPCPAIHHLHVDLHQIGWMQDHVHFLCIARHLTRYLRFHLIPTVRTLSELKYT